MAYAGTLLINGQSIVGEWRGLPLDNGAMLVDHIQMHNGLRQPLVFFTQDGMRLTIQAGTPFAFKEATGT